MTPTWGLLHISHWLHPKLKNKGSRHQSSLSIIRKPPLTPPPPSGLDLDSLKNSFKAFHTLLCINLIIDSTGKVLKLSSVRWLTPHTLMCTSVHSFQIPALFYVWPAVKSDSALQTAPCVCTGEMLSVLAWSGVLDLREHPRVGGRLHRSRGLHHSQVLRPVGQ